MGTYTVPDPEPGNGALKKEGEEKYNRGERSGLYVSEECNNLYGRSDRDQSAEHALNLNDWNLKCFKLNKCFKVNCRN